MIETAGRPFSNSHTLRHGEFRKFWAALLISQTGTWMQTVTLGWLIFRLTGSAFSLGLITMLTALPAGLLVLVGGVLADRLPRRSVILAAQSLATAQALALTVLTALGVVQLWHVIALSVVYSLASVLDEGARQAILAELVPPPDLPNASDMVMAARVLARVAGAAAAGVVLAYFNEATAFGLNSLSYGVMLGTLVFLRTPWRTALLPREQAEGGGMPAAVAEAARFALGPSGLAWIILLVALNNFFLLSIVPLLPAFVGQALGEGAPVLGWLNAAFGGGALLAAVALGVWNVRDRRRTAFALTTLAAPAAGALFAWLRWLPASALALAALGVFVVGQSALGNGLLQARAPAAMRGRLMSLNALFIYGATRVGAVALGAGVEWLGFAATITGGALLCLLASAPGLYRLRGNP